MNKAASKATEPLEWNRFLDLSIEEARTEGGKILLGRLRDPESWAPNVGASQILQEETLEISEVLHRDDLWGVLSDLTDPESSLERLTRGSVLEIVDFTLLRRWLFAIDSWRKISGDEIQNKIRGEIFKNALSKLPDLSAPIQILERILTPEGELSERASPKLASLYQEIRALKREISIQLDHVLKTLSTRGVLQENFSDVRDGRYVIPIKIASQGEVDGIIYEASASRQTVFVEAKEVSPLNNRLRQRQNELIQEIYIILDETSKKIRPHASEIQLGAKVLTHWDAVQARSRMGLRYGGKKITVTQTRHFILRQTAHPLLWWSMKPEEIIRNEIVFGEPVVTLLLTGPNTGGKTVLLKTLGLAGLCARTGFLFPALDEPTVPFFDAFFADLGDPQSIEQHLSSFSGHIQRFKEILDGLTDQSLILIDELNSATDPEEGAAIGRAFLESIMARGAMTVTTTHDPQLKAVAGSDSRILNASMQFDERARTPTYRMQIGVPGRSRALETAARLGLPSSVIELAKSYLSRAHIEFENLLNRLESDASLAEAAKREALQMRQEAEKLRAEWTQRTEASVNEMMDRTRQKLRRVLEEAQEEVRGRVKLLDEAKSRKDIDSTRQTINDTVGAAASLLESALEQEAPQIAQALQKKKASEQTTPVAQAFSVGQTVRVPKWKNSGTILEIQGSKAKVAMGALQMTLALTELEMLDSFELSALKKTQALNRPKSGRGGRTGGTQDVPTPPSQLDLRGKRLDDAMRELGQYIDQAYRCGGLAQVTIVHGVGTGAVREGTRALLAKLPYIKNYRDGGTGLGGTGATLVEFDT